MRWMVEESGKDGRRGERQMPKKCICLGAGEGGCGGGGDSMEETEPRRAFLDDRTISSVKVRKELR